MFIILLTFASYVATGVYGVSTVLAGYIITGTRVFDAITDPLIGLWCDRFESKWGRARPLTIIGWAIMSVSVFAMFKLGLGAGLGKLSVLVFILIYLVYILGYTIFNIGSGLVQPIMGKNLKDRAILDRGQTVYTTVLSSTISMILAATLMPKHNYKMGLPLFADLCVMVILASAVLIAITYIAVTTSGTDVMASYKGMSKDPIKMKDALDLVLHNRDMQMYTIAAASDKLALQTASNSAITVMIFGIIIGNYKFNASLNLVNMFVTLALLFFFVSRLAGKSGLKKANILWTSTSIAMYALMWVFLLCVDTLQITVNPVLKVVFIVLYCAMGASKMATSCVSNPLRYDIIDYEFSRSGRYMPALVNTVYSFIDKLISSLAQTLVAFIFLLCAGLKDLPTDSTPYSGGIKVAVIIMFCVIPMLAWAATLWAMKGYSLTGARMKEIQEVNAQRKQAIAQGMSLEEAMEKYK